MTSGHILRPWEPDLRLPARATLQEFVSHDKEATLRVILHIDQRAQVEVNDQIVAETKGFQSAAALAELYTRSHEILLAEEVSGSDVELGRRRYYRIRAADGAYEISSSTDPIAFVSEAEPVRPLGRSDNLTDGIEKARVDAGTPLVPAFSDEVEIYRGLGQHGSTGLVVAIWTSQWRTPFVKVLEEDEFTPLFLSVSKAPDGAYYSIYRLTNRSYLSELRSHHEAEEIGTFVSLEAAVAHCDLFNAARHSEKWVSFSKSVAEEIRSPDGDYVLHEEADGYHLRTADAGPLGCFPSVRLAEAYASAHREALEHFSLAET